MTRRSTGVHWIDLGVRKVLPIHGQPSARVLVFVCSCAFSATIVEDGEYHLRSQLTHCELHIDPDPHPIPPWAR